MMRHWLVHVSVDSPHYTSVKVVGDASALLLMRHETLKDSVGGSEKRTEPSISRAVDLALHLQTSEY